MAFLDEQGLKYIAQACDKKYLQLAGGTITGKISRSGGGLILKQETRSQ